MLRNSHNVGALIDGAAANPTARSGYAYLLYDLFSKTDHKVSNGNERGEYCMSQDEIDAAYGNARRELKAIEQELAGLHSELSKRPEFLSITHKLHSDHDAQFYVGES